MKEITFFKRLCFVVLLLLISGMERVSGQTRLGLHVTKEELSIWKQRAVNGPYKATGDVSPNSPGDWIRIQTNAKAFLGNPSQERWSGKLDPTCWSPSASASRPLPSRDKGEKLRDAAFVSLVTGDAKYRDAVRSELLAQAAMPGTNWTDRTRWLVSPSCVNGDAYNHEIAMWLTKLIYAYDYIRGSLSESDREKLDIWFLNAALFWGKNLDNIAGKRFPNRKLDDYTKHNTAYDPNGSDGSTPKVTHFGGWTKQGWMEGWSNRTATWARFLAATAVLTNHAALKSDAKRWFKETIKYATFPDGTYTDFSRWRTDAPGLGWSYAQAIYTLGTIADIFARAGDSELYSFQTTEGKYGTEGGPKSLYQMVKLHLQHVDGRTLRYGTNDLSRGENASYIIGPIDRLTNQARNIDTNVAPLNVYFKDEYFKSIYLRTAPGAPPYPPAPAGTGFCIYCGEQGTLPGVLFMFGQMEGKVWPYPSMAAPSAASSARPSPPLLLPIKK